MRAGSPRDGGPQTLRLEQAHTSGCLPTHRHCAAGGLHDDERALPAATCSSPDSTTTLAGRDVALELFSRIRHVDAGLAGCQMVDHDTGMRQQTLRSVLPQSVQGRRGRRAPSMDALDAISKPDTVDSTPRAAG